MKKQISLKNIWEGLGLLGLLILNFVFFTGFINFFSGWSISDDILELLKSKETLLMPTIVLSASFTALLNLQETSKNNRNTIEWKQKEQTINLLEDFDITITKGLSGIFNRPEILRWINDIESHNRVVSFNEALDIFKNVNKELNKEESYQDIKIHLNQLRILLNSIAYQYRYELMDKALVKDFLYYTLSKQSFIMTAILMSTFKEAYIKQYLELLEEWNIDYKTFRSRRWEP